MKTTTEANEMQAWAAAEKRMMAETQRRSANVQAELLARINARREADVVADLAERLGASFGSVAAIRVLADHYKTGAADALDSLVERGILGYDEETASVTLAMG